MKKGNIFKTMISLALIACLLPMGSVNAEGEDTTPTTCYFQGNNNGLISFTCYGQLDGLNVRTQAGNNIQSISANIESIGDGGTVTVRVNVRVIDSTKSADYTVELYNTNTKIGEQQITIDGYVPDEPDPEPEEPDVPSTPTGNVFMITEELRFLRLR